MNVRLATSKDKLVWDDYVDSRLDASPYCRLAWKEAVVKTYGHKPCYLLAENEGVIKGILPLFDFRVPFFGSSLVSLPYCDLGDVIADNEKIKNALLDEAIVIAKTSKTKEIEIRSCQENLIENCLSDYSGNVHTGKVRMLLKLPTSSDELWRGFKSKLRSQVNKSEKNGLIFRWGNIEDLDDFYYVFSRNMHDLGSPVHSKDWIRNVFTTYGDNARMGLVYKGNQPLGCGIILFTKYTVSIPWASTLREYNRLSPNMLLYWNLLKYAADNGKKTFDFGRSTPEEGTYNFKKQWGAKPEKLFWYNLNTALVEDDIYSGRARKVIGKIWQKTPLVVTNFVGPKLRKYISL